MRPSPRSSSPAATNCAAAPTSPDPKRRRFLFTLGVGGAGAAAVAVAAMPAVAATPASPDNDAEQDGRYSETAHVRDYYRTAKL